MMLMNEPRAAVDLDANGTADALARSQEMLVAAEVQQVRLVAHWADLHHTTTRDVSAHVLAGMEQEVSLGGAGTPRVREFAAAELGVLLGTTTTAAQSLLRDLLDLRHRHPRLWDAVQSGQARFWQARQIARIVHQAGLDLDQARHVDGRTAPRLGMVPWGRMIGLVEAAVVEADPERAETRRLEKAMERFVRSGQSTEHGTKTLYARVEAGHAIGFLAMCDRIAQILRADGDDAPMEVLRSEAIGWLGNPLRAAALLAQAERVVRNEGCVTQPSGQTADGPDDDRPIREGDVHPADNDADEPVPPSTPVLRMDADVDLAALLPASTLFVHLSLEQFLRRDRGAASVEGLGPVTIEHAVDLLLHTRVSIKPVIDLHETWSVDCYQVPPRIREHVRLRYPVEVFPHGTLASRRADHDHVVPYRPGATSQTSTDNIAPLARHHHRVKTHGRGWVHRQPVPGVHYWRTPHGHWARVDHRGTQNLGRHLSSADRTLIDDGADPLEHAFAAAITAA